MHNILKRTSTSVALLVLLAIPSLSQVNTYSPYTRFGLGDLSRGGFGQNQAMGGTGIAIRDDNKLNYLNPAAYTARDSMTVLLDFGLKGHMNTYSTSQLSNRWWNANFHHLALSVPIGKYFALGSGIVPYSSVGYKIKQEYNNLGTGDAIDYYFEGSGGILKYFLGVSGELFQRVSIGVNLNYLLGDIDRERSITFPRNRGFAQTQSLDQINVSQTYFGFGIQYKEVFADKFFFTIGGIYELEANLNSSITSSVSNIFPGRPAFLNDSLIIESEYDLIRDVRDETIILPAKIGVGIALGIPGKLTLTGDYYLQDWSSVTNTTLLADGFDLAASRSMHAGMEYVPDFEAFRGYHKLMSYRLGGYLNESYVMIGDYQLKDYGISFGVGLPLGKTRSSLNVAFTYGTRGTLENNLVKENYGILSFNVTLHDLWFYKRKYD